MHTTHHHILSIGESFLVRYIHSILDYADNDKAFAHALAQTITPFNWSSEVLHESEQPSSPYTRPLNQTDAVATAQWIFHTLSTHPEYTHARSQLAAWSQTHQAPKDLVLGVVGMAILGPTLGIIDIKKKKKRKAQLVLEEAYMTSLTAQELATLCTELTQVVMAQETKLAGGNIYALHPDSAAWCLEEAVTALYSDKPDNLTSLLTTAGTENVSHISQKDARGHVQAIVIAPSVNDELVDESTAQKH